jgi:hypothetical protein
MSLKSIITSKDETDLYNLESGGVEFNVDAHKNAEGMVLSLEVSIPNTPSLNMMALESERSKKLKCVEEKIEAFKKMAHLFARSM